jgi:hypothetical protein
MFVNQSSEDEKTRHENEKDLFLNIRSVIIEQMFFIKICGG